MNPKKPNQKTRISQLRAQGWNIHDTYRRGSQERNRLKQSDIRFQATSATGTRFGNRTMGELLDEVETYIKNLPRTQTNQKLYHSCVDWAGAFTQEVKRWDDGDFVHLGGLMEKIRGLLVKHGKTPNQNTSTEFIISKS